MNLGRGYKPDPAGHRWTPFAALQAARLALADLPDAHDLRSYSPRVFDQGPTSSCVGHATATAIYTACHAYGLPLDFVPSPRLIYTLARCLGSVDSGQPLDAAIDDYGCAPNEAMRGIGEWGISPLDDLSPDGRYSDCWATTINAKPRLDELEQESLHLIGGKYQIASRGDALIRDVKRAISSGYPVTFAIDADALDYTGQPFGEQRGTADHYLCALAYRTVGNSTVITFRNSWGDAWGAHGEAEGDESFVDSWSAAFAMQVSE